MENDRACLLCYPWAIYSDLGLACLQMLLPLAPPEPVHSATATELCCRLTATLLLPLELDAAACVKPDASADKTQDAKSHSAGLGVFQAAFTIRSPGAATRRHPSLSACNLPSPAGSRSSWKRACSHQAIWLLLHHVLCCGEGSCVVLPMHQTWRSLKHTKTLYMG